MRKELYFLIMKKEGGTGRHNIYHWVVYIRETFIYTYIYI